MAPNDWTLAVSGAGDINNDGIGDVIVGARLADPHQANAGAAYVVFGRDSPFPRRIKLSTLDGATGFRLAGVSAGDFAGVSVAGVGDVNSDGVDDLAIGADGADPHGISSGSSYVVFGRKSGFPPNIDLSSLDGSSGFRLDGAAAGDSSGTNVASVGDVNNDGIGDVIVGAHYAEPHGFNSGSSYVVFGRASSFPASIDLSTLDGEIGFRLDGAAVSDHSGGSVANAGDINGDGVSDLIIGAEGAGNWSGSTYVVFGRP